MQVAVVAAGAVALGQEAEEEEQEEETPEHQGKDQGRGTVVEGEIKALGNVVAAEVEVEARLLRVLWLPVGMVLQLL